MGYIDFLDSRRRLRIFATTLRPSGRFATMEIERCAGYRSGDCSTLVFADQSSNRLLKVLSSCIPSLCFSIKHSLRAVDPMTELQLNVANINNFMLMGE